MFIYIYTRPKGTKKNTFPVHNTKYIKWTHHVVGNVDRKGRGKMKRSWFPATSFF